MFQTTEPNSPKFLDLRSNFLNFLGLMILGSILIIFQHGSCDKLLNTRTIIFWYYLAALFLLAAKYLFMHRMRTSIETPLKYEELGSRATMISLVFYFIGTIWGLYHIIPSIFAFLFIFLITLAVVLFCFNVEFGYIKSILRKKDQG